MHTAGFIHGDMKIDNCLLRMDDCDTILNVRYDPTGNGGWKYHGVKLIDFGRTVDTNMFPSGQEFLGDWKTNKGDCIEAQEGRPWTYQTDYFGLAGIFHCLLYGKFLETTFNDEDGIVQLRHPLKRYWQEKLWVPRLRDSLEFLECERGWLFADDCCPEGAQRGDGGLVGGTNFIEESCQEG